MEPSVVNPDKSQNVLVTLREHLKVTFPNLATTLPMSQIRNDTLGNISMVMPLKSQAEPSGNTTKGYINMGLPLDTPTFMLQFKPITIENDEEYPRPSSKSLVNVSVATYHGLILRSDQFTFYISFTNLDNFDEAELRLSTCELLNRLEHYSSGFRLCAGLDEPENLDPKKAFIEPYGEDRGLVIVRSRNCQFMLELEEMYSGDEIDVGRNNCVQCGLLINDSLCVKTEFPKRNIFEEESDNELLANTEEGIEDFFSNENDKLNDPDWSHPQRKPLAQITDMYPCDHCDQHFKTERALIRHKERETSSKFCCDKCNRRFKTEVILEDHKSRCTGGESSTGKRGPKKKKKQPLVLKRMKKSVKSKKSFSDENKAGQVCPLCFRVFTMPTRFEQHMELHKKRMNELFNETQCPGLDCGMSFPDRIALSEHYQLAHDEESAPCGYCVKVFKRSKMRSHLFNDHPAQKYVCQICFKELPFLSHLKQHTQDMHGGEKSRDIVCHHCGNRYRREAGLRQHLASAHSNHRDFHCFHCGKGFTTQTRLTQHIRIHTGSKPFKCKLCEYKSNRADNVLIHVRKVHKVRNPSRNEDIITVFEELQDNDFKSFPIKMEDEVENPSDGTTTTTLTALVVNTVTA